MYLTMYSLEENSGPDKKWHGRGRLHHLVLFRRDESAQMSCCFLKKESRLSAALKQEETLLISSQNLLL